jgi:allophanate hydrolase subunit 2
MMPGNTIRFQRMNRQTALNLLREEVQHLDRLRQLLS